MSNIVTSKQAKRLRNLGYNIWSQFSYYRTDITFQKTPKKFTSDYTVAPTVCEALDYLREEKEIYCGVHPFMWGYKGVAIIQDKYNPCTIEVEPLDTHPLAESALLTAVLDYLEKKGGEG